MSGIREVWTSSSSPPYDEGWSFIYLTENEEENFRPVIYDNEASEYEEDDMEWEGEQIRTPPGTPELIDLESDQESECPFHNSGDNADAIVEDVQPVVLLELDTNPVAVAVDVDLPPSLPDDTPIINVPALVARGIYPCDDFQQYAGAGSSNNNNDRQTQIVNRTASHQQQIAAIREIPFDIDDVFQRILGYVPRPSILNCRLVSCRWNSNAVAVMKRKGWDREIIGCEGRGGLIQYSRQQRRQQRLAIGGSEPVVELPKLNLSINLGLEYVGSISGIASALTTITTLGNRDVSSLTFAPYPNYAWKRAPNKWTRILDTLRHIALGLKCLSIKENSPFVDVDNPCSSPAAAAADLPPFPELLDLTFLPVKGSAQILARIVNASPKLQKLTITWESRGNCDDESESNIRVICEDVLVTFIAFTSEFKHLLELNVDLSLSGEDSYVALTHVHFPILQKLKLKIISRSTTNADTRHLKQFLQKNCPHLKSLEFEFTQFIDPQQGADPNIFPSELSIPEMPAGLPQLPQLTHFGYFIEGYLRPSYISMTNLTANHFANLKSITLKFGQFFCALPPIPSIPDPRVVVCQPGQVGHVIIKNCYSNPKFLDQFLFNSVSEMKLIVDGFIERDNFGNYAKRDLTPVKYCHQLHLLFPNLNALCVDNQLPPTRHEQPEFKIILLTVLGILPGIVKLEIRNYYHDWLAEILTEFPSPVANLNGLKSITFPPFQKNPDVWMDGITSIVASQDAPRPPIPPLSVQTLLQHVPGIELLRVHDAFLRQADRQRQMVNLTTRPAPAAVIDKNIDDILQEFTQAFPNVKIELL